MEFIKTLNSWTHTSTASLALIIGAYVIFATKGDKTHKKMGVFYYYLMIINCVTSLFIYNAKGKWFFSHSFAVATLITILPGYLITFKKSYKHWLKIHIFFMIFSYYMLIGGAINEAFLRIEQFKKYGYGSQVFGLTQFFAMLLFTAMLIYFLIRYWKGTRMKIKTE